MNPEAELCWRSNEAEDREEDCVIPPPKIRRSPNKLAVDVVSSPKNKPMAIATNKVRIEAMDRKAILLVLDVLVWLELEVVSLGDAGGDIYKHASSYFSSCAIQVEEEEEERVIYPVLCRIYKNG